jgi:hypothetical protein
MSLFSYTKQGTRDYYENFSLVAFHRCDEGSEEKSIGPANRRFAYAQACVFFGPNSSRNVATRRTACAEKRS